MALNYAYIFAAIDIFASVPHNSVGKHATELYKFVVIDTLASVPHNQYYWQVCHTTDIIGKRATRL